MNSKQAYLMFLFTLSRAHNNPRDLDIPDALNLSKLQSFVASAQSRGGEHASSVIANVQSVLSDAASAVPSDLISKADEVFATATLSGAAADASPNVAAGLALLNGAIAVAAGWDWAD